MKIVRGHYDGRVVVLDEPAPVDREVTVTISFPEEGDVPSSWPAARRQFHWQEARAIEDAAVGSLSDEVSRQRSEVRF